MRKQPRQLRSRAMVDSLIEATALSIVEVGLDGLTTNHVAQKAGVSVGSLYQYFNSKEALVGALIERSIQDVTELASQQAPLLQNMDLETVLRTLLKTVFVFLQTRDGLYLELIRNWNQLPFGNAADRIEQHLVELGRQYFVQHLQDYPIQDLNTRLFLVINSTLFTLVRYVSQEHPVLTQEQVAEGLTDMVTGYLGRS